MTVSEIRNFSGLLGEGEVPLYVTRWSLVPLVCWNLLAAPLYFLGVPMLFDASVRGPAFVLLAIALLITGLAYASWVGRTVIVSNRRLVYHAAFTRSVNAAPLDKIELVTSSPGSVVVRTGTVFNKITMFVPDAEALAAAIERARANLSVEVVTPETAAFVPLRAPVRATADTKHKATSQADVIVGSVVFFFILIGFAIYNLQGSPPDQSVMHLPLDNRENSPRPEATNAPMVIVQSVVPEDISTDFLMDCWRKSIRGTPAIVATGDVNGDILARYVGRGGINVRVEVVGNRINTQTFELISATIPGSQERVDYKLPTGGGRMYYADALEIYETAFRALTRCGTDGVPQPNGVYLFTFDPGRAEILVTRIAEEPRSMAAAASGSTAPVPSSINTDALTACWMRDIRGVSGWTQSGGRDGDNLSHLYGKGGVSVQIVVENNRLDLRQLSLVGATGDGGDAPIKEWEATRLSGLDYWDAQDVYTSALQAITHCGLADDPLPNGRYQFIFDPTRDSILALPSGN